MALDTFEEADAARGVAPSVPTPAGGELLSLRNVARHFRTKRADTLALDHVSLSVREG